MNAVVESVRSLWVPMDGLNLLVPNVAIAEVISLQPLHTVQSGPEWLLGSMRWRDRDLPVVALESLCGFGAPRSGRNARVCVLNAVNAGSGLPFYGIVAAGIPRLINVDADSLGESLLATRSLPDTVADLVRIGGEEALIPNLQLVQKLVESGWADIDRQA